MWFFPLKRQTSGWQVIFCDFLAVCVIAKQICDEVMNTLSDKFCSYCIQQRTVEPALPRWRQIVLLLQPRHLHVGCFPALTRYRQDPRQLQRQHQETLQSQAKVRCYFFFFFLVRSMVRDCRLSCLSVTLVYCGPTVGWIKMPLGMEVYLAPGHIVFDGGWGPISPPPLPKGV